MKDPAPAMAEILSDVSAYASEPAPDARSDDDSLASSDEEEQAL